MRSVAFHLINTTKGDVARFLDEVAVPIGWVVQWNFPRASETIYVRFYDELEDEGQDDDLATLKGTLGRFREVSVIADVSGRIPGDTEVKALAGLLLGGFNGVAEDGYTDHCWTLAEIRSGVQARGHEFFDYNGWYREHKLNGTIP